MSSIKTTIDESFFERLRELIEVKLKIKQSEFANNIGVTAGYLSMVVTGKRGPSAKLIAGIFINYSEYLAWLLNQPNFYELQLEKKKKEEITQFEDPILSELKLWLNELRGKEPMTSSWFAVELKKKFPEFNDWLEKKREVVSIETNQEGSKIKSKKGAA